MAEVVDSIIAELIARDQGYIETFDRATAAHGRFKASVDKLKVQTFDLGAEGQKYKQGVNGMAQAEEQSSARMVRAKKNVSDATKAKADAEKAAARAIADAQRAEQKSREAAERASVKAAAAAQKEAEKKALAAKLAADAVVAAAAREEAARARIAAMVDRSLTRGGVQPGSGANLGRTVPREAAAIPNSVVPAAVEAEAAGKVIAEKEVNHLLADQAVLQAGLTTARGREREYIADQITELRLINTLKRAGLTDEQATIRAEATLAAIEAERVATARKQAASGALRFAEGAGISRTGGSTAAIAGIAAAGAVAGTIALAKAGLDYAQSLKQISAQLGLTTHEFQIYQAAAQQSGVKTEQFRESVGQLAGNLGKAQEGGEQQQKIFAALNIDIGNAKDGYKTLSQVLPTLIDRLSQIPDQTRRFAIETALGGEQLRRLDPILSGGTASFDALAASIEKTGGLLSDEQIQNADRTAVKLQQLGDQLQRDLAGTVANNASAIENLATAFFRAADGALKFFSAMTNSGNLDILNSPKLTNFASNLLGNDPNKTRSQAFGDLLANPEGRRALAARNAAALNELNRVDQLRKVANAGLTATTANGVTTLSGGADVRTSLNTTIPGLQDVSDTSQGRYAAYVRLNAERQRILAADRASKAANVAGGAQTGVVGDTSKLFAPKAPKGKSAEALENERLQRERQFKDQLAQSQEELLRAREQQTGDVEKQAEIEKELADRAYQRRLDDIETQRKASINRGGDSALENARAEQLKAAADAVHKAEVAGIEQKKQVQIQQAATAHLETALGIEADTLGFKLSLAQTAKERRDIELQLLENARKQKEAELNSTINNPLSSPSAIQDAREQLKALPAQADLQRKGIEQREAGPFAAYLKTLPDSADKVKEAFEQAAVSGVQNLNDKLADTIGKFLHLHGLAGQFLHDLIKIGVEKAALAVFSGGASTGLASIGGLFGFAGGGHIIVGGNGGIDNNVMSINGRPVARVNQGEHINIVPANQAVSAGGGSGGVTVLQTVSVDARGAVMNDQFAAMILSRAGQQAAQISAVASKATLGAVPGKLSKMQNLGNS